MSKDTLQFCANIFREDHKHLHSTEKGWSILWLMLPETTSISWYSGHHLHKATYDDPLTWVHATHSTPSWGSGIPYPSRDNNQFSNTMSSMHDIRQGPIKFRIRIVIYNDISSTHFTPPFHINQVHTYHSTNPRERERLRFASRLVSAEIKHLCQCRSFPHRCSWRPQSHPKLIYE